MKFEKQVLEQYPGELRGQAKKIGLCGHTIPEEWAQSRGRGEIAFPVAPRRKSQHGMLFREKSAAGNLPRAVQSQPMNRTIDSATAAGFSDPSISTVNLRVACTPLLS